MNSEIAKQRLSEVVRIDTITSSYGDFMATHVPFKQIQLQKEYDSSTASKTYTEEQIYKYDQELFDEVKKYSTSTSKAER